MAEGFFAGVVGAISLPALIGIGAVVLVIVIVVVVYKD